MSRILVIVTNTADYEKVGFRTGLWLGELTHFTDVVEGAGHEVTLASPHGGYVPIDPESLSTLMLKQGGTDKRYADPAYMARLKNTVPVSDVNPDDFDAIYFTGGHGVMFDFRTDALAELTARFAEDDKVVASVCHGAAGLLDVKRADGSWLLEGRSVTGFSWPEEKLAQREKAVPFNLQEELQARGAHYTKSRIPFKSKVVTDGLLITGQNPGSAEDVAKAVVKALKKTQKKSAKKSAKNVTT